MRRTPWIGRRSDGNPRLLEAVIGPERAGSPSEDRGKRKKIALALSQSVCTGCVIEDDNDSMPVRTSRCGPNFSSRPSHPERSTWTREIALQRLCRGASRSDSTARDGVNGAAAPSKLGTGDPASSSQLPCNWLLQIERGCCDSIRGRVLTAAGVE